MDAGNELSSIRFRSIEEFIPYREALLRLCEECCGTVDGLALFVALNEGVNNALQHGKKDTSEGVVDLSVKREKEQLRVDIRSAGGGLLGLPPLFDRPLPKSLEESGRGLHIIGSLVDHFSIEATDSHVTLCLEKRREEEIVHEES
ncbi:MAG: ATP-binding protein [Synergistaceae bacterium]|nr:ATP-binding protein [Synergistaceae bacterium]